MKSSEDQLQSKIAVNLQSTERRKKMKEDTTSNNIVEMQGSNQKLLLKLHDLRNKFLEMEEVKNQINCWKIGNPNLERRFFDSKQSRRADEDLLTINQMLREGMGKLNQLSFNDGERNKLEEELLSVDSKSQSQANFVNEQIDLQNQLQILEDLNQINDIRISELEVDNKSLRQNLSTAKNRCENLERKFEGRMQIDQVEKQLNEQIRRSKTFSLKLEEVQSRLMEEVESLKLENKNTVMKMIDEHELTENLRSKLAEQVESQNQQIKDLSEKLREALKQRESDHHLAEINKDLELQVKNKTTEIQQLQLELQEKAAKMKKDNDWKADLQASYINETNLKSHIEELQQEIHTLLFDVRELKESQKITKNDKEQCELRTECRKLNDELTKCQEHQFRLDKDETDDRTNTNKKNNIKKISFEKLLSLVKNLRREKAMAITRIESLNNENFRMSAELKIKKKQVDELNRQLTDAKQKNTNLTLKLIHTNEAISIESQLNELPSTNHSTFINRQIKSEIQTPKNCQSKLKKKKKEMSEQDDAKQKTITGLAHQDEKLDTHLKPPANSNIKTLVTDPRSGDDTPIRSVSSQEIQSNRTPSSSHHNDSSSNSVRTTRGATKRTRDTESDNHINVEDSVELNCLAEPSSSSHLTSTQPAIKRKSVDASMVQTDKNVKNMDDVESAHGGSEAVSFNGKAAYDLLKEAEKHNEGTGNIKRGRLPRSTSKDTQPEVMSLRPKTDGGDHILTRLTTRNRQT